ncbi:AI-2E family transporter [Sphingomonas sp. NSE70-1]|uniref:AI-2E family transporter n=1 Tax=Sphingomonas caseinilyticus TaxID=2908205 RepID=A0ABT0RUK4_9SPHN|nr:AI-2E family transporter [Sphingomonas caseinilyticus]MCL6698636.1 AI-2E family transporter [Sphingomonas caseinilyticus]
MLTDQPPSPSPVERPGPADLYSRSVRDEARKAAVWLGMALLIVGVIVLSQPLLLIIGGMVFAVVLDGGARLLGRVLPIGRGWRLAMVTIAGFAFVGWVFYFAGTTLAGQAEELRIVVTEQGRRLFAFLIELGLMPADGTGLQSFSQQMLGGVGRLTTAVSTAVGAVASILMIMVIGIFIAIEPRLYDRGFAWMLPVEKRSSFYEISDKVGFTLRRLLAGRIVGMMFEGVFTFAMLAIGGVPMAALLGLLTGMLAFIPNIGAIISGALMVAVGFSAGPGEGLWAIFVYFFVQNVDGYLVVPYIARRTVDLAPALVLAAQLLFGALFGILGLLLADPILASIKVTLQKLSERQEPAPQVAAATAPPRKPATRKRKKT